MSSFLKKFNVVLFGLLVVVSIALSLQFGISASRQQRSSNEKNISVESCQIFNDSVSNAVSNGTRIAVDNILKKEYS